MLGSGHHHRFLLLCDVLGLWEYLETRRCCLVKSRGPEALINPIAANLRLFCIGDGLVKPRYRGQSPGLGFF